MSTGCSYTIAAAAAAVNSIEKSLHFRNCRGLEEYSRIELCYDILIDYKNKGC